MKPPLGYHLVFRLEDSRVIAPSPALRRRFARAFARLAKVFPLLVWRVVDTHLHVVGLLSTVQVDALARRLRMVVAHLHPNVELLLSQRIPVRDQWHLGNVFQYVLRQDTHHGMGADPFQEGSAVCDLLNLRVLGTDLSEVLRERLPRVVDEELVPHLRVDVLEEGVSLRFLAEAACAAFALASLGGRDEEVVEARLAAVHAAPEEAAAAVALALGVHVRSVHRCRLLAAAPVHVRAVRLQMGLRIRAAALRARAAPADRVAEPPPRSPGP